MFLFFFGGTCNLKRFLRALLIEGTNKIFKTNLHLITELTFLVV